MAVKTRDELIAAGYVPGNLANCKGCGAAIEWWTTPMKKAMPMSAPRDGAVVGLESHWGTCPKAKEFKKRSWNQQPPQRS